MTKRIFRSICLVAICVFIASITLFMGVLYSYFSGVQLSQLKMQTALAAQGVAHEGSAYFEGLSPDSYRITWIDADGTVLFDSRSDLSEMENHLEREEVKEALANGLGQSIRYSRTLLERALYCAQHLPDGTVIRLSVAQSTPFTLFLGMTGPICLIFAAAVAFSLVLASRLSKNIVRPLNQLDLDHPLSNEGYDELSPLLRRLSVQQQQIRQQTSELFQKQQEFEAVTTGMAEGIVLMNSRQVILSINPAAQRLLGTDACCVGEFMQSVNRSPELQQLLCQAESGVHSEKVLSLCGGNYQLDASPILSDGKISGMALLLLDVTEKEKAEQMRREFTANVSHELKTPLHTISGCAELMANGMVRPQDLPKFSSQIYTEAQRMIRLVEDIIRLSHLDEGAQDMKPETVDLYSIARETVKSLEPSANACKVELHLEGKPAVLTGIPQLLQGIVYNLCDNAIKYNHPGGSVTVTVQTEPQAVCLTVADTGIGIPPEHTERIFERFYRVDKSHSKEIGGTGLGLSIVKHSAKLHNAVIDLQSTPGKGTAISVRFPAAPLQGGPAFSALPNA